MNNVVISFFKENKIAYKINNNSTITYPCFYCGGESTISLVRTYFSCNKCKKTGTLAHLIRFLEENDSSRIKRIQQADIYDEDREIRELINLLNKLDNESLAFAIKEKVYKILERKKI